MSGKKDSDKNSFKESMTGIEKYWNDLNLDLDKKKKDLDDLERMDKIYSMDEIEYVKDRVRQRIHAINGITQHSKNNVGCKNKNFIL